MQEVEIEDIIDYLTGPGGFKVNDIVERSGLERATFYSWRRSTKKARRANLAQKIIELYPEVFPDGQIPARLGIQAQTDHSPEVGKMTEPNRAPNAGQPIEIRYIEMLERDNDALRAEVEALKAENRELIKEMRGELNQARKQTFQRAT